MNEPESLFPEHDKLHKIRSQSQLIGEFLEWLSYSKGISLGTPVHDLLAEFFEIDLKKLEAEKRAMLWSIRTGLDIS